MLDLVSSNNVTPLNVMEKIGLHISRPYQSMCATDSRKIKVHVLIKDLQERLAAYLDVVFLWIVGVIDVLDPRGMFLSRKWVANLGGSIQLEKFINLNTMFIEISMPLIAHFHKINS